MEPTTASTRAKISQPEISGMALGQSGSGPGSNGMPTSTGPASHPTQSPSPSLTQSQNQSQSQNPNPNQRGGSVTVSVSASVAGDDATRPPKRKRRVLACQACQKVKCKCEYDAISHSCRRCQSLRLDCSLSAETPRDAMLARGGDVRYSIEERLGQNEDSLSEVKALLRTVIAQTSPGAQSSKDHIRLFDDSRGHIAESHLSEPSHVSDISDKTVRNAPASVLREVGEQLMGGHRRLLQNVNFDVVRMAILNQNTAEELFRTFLGSRGDLLIAYDAHSRASLAQLREESPFLYGMCCLTGIRYGDRKVFGTMVHRQIYEQVRLTLGQVLIASPLPLAEINAVAILASVAATPSNNGTEWIDSWLLSGYCSQQALLTINFSAIIRAVREGRSTLEHYRAIRLWCQICLDHLQWAAATGRPSMLVESYVNQCNILLNMSLATTQDSMTVAAVLLYANLLRNLGTVTAADDQTEAFTSWKDRWNNLFTYPKSSLLKLNYYSAHLILSTQSLQEPPSAGAMPHMVGKGNEASLDNATVLSSYHYSLLIIQTFVDMAHSTIVEASDFLCMCAAYSALFLATHISWSKTPTHSIYELIHSFEQCCHACPSINNAPLMTANLAKRKLEEVLWAQDQSRDCAVVGGQPWQHVQEHPPTGPTGPTMVDDSLKHMADWNGGAVMDMARFQEFFASSSTHGIPPH
ncbi:hypothetical protein F4780DRAFT_283774 [Xylariomycetidae sp. FL0641]|nr:hypothetical protein F4780DRAFT_283774 [Xylariomycetidae sp. FL0641]